MYYYAVKVGRKVGIFSNWDECENEVRGYPAAKYKKFKTIEEAKAFINGDESKNKIPKKKTEGNKDINNDIEIDFDKIEENSAVVYVDGSFNSGDFTYSYGVVFLTKEGKETFSGRDDNEHLAVMRNVSGELKGAMVAMQVAVEKKIDKIYLHYDYMGIEEWALGRWKTNKDGTKFYKKFYDDISKKLEVKFIKVKAHSGVRYNDEADKLAKDAL